MNNHSMTPQIKAIVKALHALSYSDTIELATALSRKTGVSDVTKLALALASLHGEFAGAEQVSSMEEQALRDMVGTRRRGFTLKVGKQPKGWTAYIEEFSGQSVAQAPEARMAIAQSLDLAIGSHLMMK